MDGVRSCIFAWSRDGSEWQAHADAPHDLKTIAAYQAPTRADEPPSEDVSASGEATDAPVGMAEVAFDADESVVRRGREGSERESD